ncbi:hypothetical protein L916_12505, partial [Phytophthora nicotianae]
RRRLQVVWIVAVASQQTAVTTPDLEKIAKGAKWTERKYARTRGDTKDGSVRWVRNDKGDEIRRGPK